MTHHRLPSPRWLHRTVLTLAAVLVLAGAAGGGALCWQQWHIPYPGFLTTFAALGGALLGALPGVALATLWWRVSE